MALCRNTLDYSASFSLSEESSSDLSSGIVFCFFRSVIPLKSELAVELQEKGRVRFWLQAEKISANGKVDYVFNDNSLSAGEVSVQRRQSTVLPPIVFIVTGLFFVAT